MKQSRLLLAIGAVLLVSSLYMFENDITITGSAVADNSTPVSTVLLVIISIALIGAYFIARYSKK